MEFQDLSRKLTPTIKRIAYRLNGRYRTFSHEDLYQEAIIHLWSDFKAGKLDTKTDSYILQGCYFHLKNYIRKVNEKPQVSLDAITYAGDELLNMKDFLIDERQQDVRKSLDIKLLAQEVIGKGISFREKFVLESLSNGLTAREIGRRLSLSHVMVGRIISKIRQKCREDIK